MKNHIFLRRVLCLLSLVALLGFALPPPIAGIVSFAGVPVPGAVVTAKAGDKSVSVVTDQDGLYAFASLDPGDWTFSVTLPGFAPQSKPVAVAAADNAAVNFTLSALPLSAFPASAANAVPPPVLSTRAAAPAAPAGAKSSAPAANARPAAPAGNAAAPSFGAADMSTSAGDALAVNGSVLNGAASIYGQSQAFGNNRPGTRRLFTGGISLMENNAALDARPFSLTGQSTPRPQFNDLTAGVQIGGPVILPHIHWQSNPFFQVSYQTTRNRTDGDLDGLLPTDDERAGNLGAVSTPILDPATGQPFQGNQVPVSPQAKALLALYPEPNLVGNPVYNYQIASVGDTHQDALQSRLNKSVTRKDSLAFQYAVQDSRIDATNLFGFVDATDTLGQQGTLQWRRMFTARSYATFSVQLSRSASTAAPFFANRTNVSGIAGIAGNNQSPLYWGPPSLLFTSGIAGLSDGSSSHNRNQTAAYGYQGFWNHGGHNLEWGADVKRQDYNFNSQQNARGSFVFNGQITGNDFADFLLGLPDTASLAYGNADKYFRGTLTDFFVGDDFRLSDVTFNTGLRWEYATPETELYNRLVNLDIAPDFTAAAPVLASAPTGPVTGMTYPNALLHPDHDGFEPRIGLAWRPFPASAMVVRAGYGMAFNTSVYQSIAQQMAQQSPLSKSLSVTTTAADPLTLATAFNATPTNSPDQFAVDPNFRVGYVQNWNLSVQEDLPAALVLTLTYTGTKGTRAAQIFLPNTYAPGAANPCPSCPVGFEYLTSNGNSNREAGSAQLARRFRSGFQATMTYTWAKAMDDAAALGASGVGGQPAQDWLNLDGERGLSSFDQRQALSATVQYTTGVGARGGALLGGWEGRAYKGWTLQTAITAASGTPWTPETTELVAGAVQADVRPVATGQPDYAAAPGFFANGAAFADPAAGQWGAVGRDSLIGPGQFSLNASMQRSFQMRDRMAASLRFDLTNALNRVEFSSGDLNYYVGNPQFGAPTSANPMRSMQTTFRWTF